MAVYMLFIRDGVIRDPEAMAEYSRLNRENAGRMKVKPLIVYGKTEALEGEAPDGIVLVEFDTREEALAWYNSPDYQAAIPYRKKGAEYRAMMVEGLPSA